MKTAMSKISFKGQTTIPKEVRESLGADSGDLLQYEIEGNVVRLRKISIEEGIWLKSIQATLTEWDGNEDDDL